MLKTTKAKVKDGIKVKIKDLAKSLQKNYMKIAEETEINYHTLCSYANARRELNYSDLHKLCKTYNLQIKDVLEIC